MSDKVVEGRSFWRDKAFHRIQCGEREPALFLEFLESHDFRPNTLRAFSNDLHGFMLWFTERNAERFVIDRVSTRDVTDFKTYQRSTKGLAVATVNRSLVTIRKFFGWLVERGVLSSNPADGVKELKRVALAPQGLDAAAVRRLLRECELRKDIRASAIFNLFLYTGARVSDDLPPINVATFRERISGGANQGRARDATREEVHCGADHREAPRG